MCLTLFFKYRHWVGSTASAFSDGLSVKYAYLVPVYAGERYGYLFEMLQNAL